eukprot:1687590-Rhodomonas_salina.1
MELLDVRGRDERVLQRRVLRQPSEKKGQHASVGEILQVSLGAWVEGDLERLEILVVEDERDTFQTAPRDFLHRLCHLLCPLRAQRSPICCNRESLVASCESVVWEKGEI